MINKQTFDFLRKLARNNNREWFNANKKQYEQSRGEMRELTMFLIGEIGKFDETVQGVLPEDCLFRIYRDVRFSREKAPYKTNMGSFIKSGGRRTSGAGYYLHIAPGESMLAVGIYMPPAPELNALRNAIVKDSAAFRKIISNRALVREFGELQGERLKTAPRGFPRDHPEVEFLKLKSYTFFKSITDDEVVRDDFPRRAVRSFMAGADFNRHINGVLGV